jgi:hypothetical protein
MGNPIPTTSHIKEGPKTSNSGSTDNVQASYGSSDLCKASKAVHHAADPLKMPILSLELGSIVIWAAQLPSKIAFEQI